MPEPPRPSFPPPFAKASEGKPRADATRLCYSALEPQDRRSILSVFQHYEFFPRKLKLIQNWPALLEELAPKADKTTSSVRHPACPK